MSYPAESIQLRDEGVAALRDGRYEDAEPVLRRAFEAGHAGAAWDLAHIELNRDNRDEAIRWWHRGAELNDPECLFEVGYLDEARGDLAAAEVWYRRGIAVGGSGCLLNMANILEQRGELAEAVELHQRAWENGSDKAAFNLGRIHDDGGRGDLETAALWYDRAAKHGNAGAAFNLGFVRSDQGDREGMLDAWRRAAGFGHPKAAAALAEHYRQHGTPAQARYWSEFADGPSIFSPEFDAFGAWGSAAAIHRQDLLNDVLGTNVERFDIAARELYTTDETYGGLTFLGSFSHLDESWLWSWANPNFSPDQGAVAPVAAIREHGVCEGIPEFMTARLDLSNFPNPKQAAATMAIAAADLLGGNGVTVCKISEGRGVTFFQMDDPRLPADEYDPFAMPRLLMTAAQVFPADQRLVVRGALNHYGPSRIHESPTVISGELPQGHRLAVEFTEEGYIQAITSDPARPES